MDTLEPVYGLHAVSALLQHHGKRVKQLKCLQGRADKRLQDLLALTDTSIPVQWLTKTELDELCDGNHQGVIAYCSPSHTVSRNELFALLDRLDEPALLLILDNVTDPHNLGACLRTAEAAGAHALVIPKHKSAGLNATVRKVACGAAEILPLVTVSNLVQLLGQLQKRGVWVAGAAGEAQQSLYQADLTGPLALVMGAEGKGMRRLTRENCDYLLSIPMGGLISSLNVSVASGVCLFEAQRQRSL